MCVCVVFFVSLSSISLVVALVVALVAVAVAHLARSARRGVT
jgi:hypothetical protein